MDPIAIKTKREFLGVPQGSTGLVVSCRGGRIMGAIDVKFKCKPDPVQIPWPLELYYDELFDTGDYHDQ